MNELIKITYNNDRPAVSARDLHDFLEVDTPYHKWFPRMCEYGFTNGEDFLVTDNFVPNSAQARLQSSSAKLLKQNGVDIGQHRLFRWMRENGYLIRRKGLDFNMPTQKSMDLGLFTVKETAITHSDGTVTVSKTTKVTGKGQQYFIEKFLAG